MKQLFQAARTEGWRRILSSMDKIDQVRNDLASAQKGRDQIEADIAKAKKAIDIVEGIIATFGQAVENDEEINGGDAVDYLVRIVAEAQAVFKSKNPEAMEAFHGYLVVEGTTLNVGFEAPIGATTAEKDAAFLAAIAQQADINYLSIGEIRGEDNRDHLLKHWVVVYGEIGLFFHCQAENRELAIEQCESAYPGEKIHVAVPADSRGYLVTASITENPMTCPKCGSRTNFGDLPNNMQIHVCMACNHSFLAEHDDEAGTS